MKDTIFMERYIYIVLICLGIANLNYSRDISNTETPDYLTTIPDYFGYRNEPEEDIRERLYEISTNPLKDQYYPVEEYGPVDRTDYYKK